ARGGQRAATRARAATAALASTSASAHRLRSPTRRSTCRPSCAESERGAATTARWRPGVELELGLWERAAARAGAAVRSDSLSGVSSPGPPNRTALFQRHRDAGARFVEFAGWEMPLHYQSARAEHMAVRQTCGIFDVSHMGQIDTSGPQAAALRGVRVSIY